MWCASSPLPRGPSAQVLVCAYITFLNGGILTRAAKAQRIDGVDGVLYSGERFDSSLNLYHLRARYYNMLTGRFMTMDPMQGTSCCRSGSCSYGFEVVPVLGICAPKASNVYVSVTVPALLARKRGLPWPSYP